MNLTQTTALKWTFYALAAAALFFLRRLLLGSMTFFGVIPFLPPVILAVMASFELPRSSVIAGIVFGALCDLVIPAPFACLYTIAFTLAALLFHRCQQFAAAGLCPCAALDRADISAR